MTSLEDRIAVNIATALMYTANDREALYYLARKSASLEFKLELEEIAKEAGEIAVQDLRKARRERWTEAEQKRAGKRFSNVKENVNVE